MAMTTPTVPESHRDLLDAGVAVLATNGPDGRPQLSAIWFLYEDGQIRISLTNTRQKFKNLSSDPKVTFFVLDPDAPTRYLEVRGDAQIEDDSNYAFGDRIGKKYNADIRNFTQPAEKRVVVTIKPTRVNAIDMAAGR